jgi:hypothetical protein
MREACLPSHGPAQPTDGITFCAVGISPQEQAFNPAAEGLPRPEAVDLRFAPRPFRPAGSTRPPSQERAAALLPEPPFVRLGYAVTISGAKGREKTERPITGF